MKAAHLQRYLVINVIFILLVIVVMTIIILKREKYKPYEEISGEFKKIKPPTFNGETEKGKEA